MSKAAAFLFDNGNAAYFNDDGEQLPGLQRKGWNGVWEFRGIYPGAPISCQPSVSSLERLKEIRIKALTGKFYD